MKKIFAFFLASAFVVQAFAGDVWQLTSQQNVLGLYLQANQSFSIRVNERLTSGKAVMPIYVLCNGSEHRVAPGNAITCLTEYEQYLSLGLYSKDADARSEGTYEITVE
ncbi:MAG: hypothetical protein ACYC0J_05005 [Gammaproteobacteria bacterium]